MPHLIGGAVLVRISPPSFAICPVFFAVLEIAAMGRVADLKTFKSSAWLPRLLLPVYARSRDRQRAYPGDMFNYHGLNQRTRLRPKPLSTLGPHAGFTFL